MTTEIVTTEEKGLPGKPTPEQEKAFAQAMEQFSKVVASYSDNRKDRRKFKKIYGQMPPAAHFPHVKAMLKECPCDNCVKLYGTKPEDK